MPSWERAAIAVGAILATLVLAKLVDRRMTRRDLAPETATRYRVLRRSIVAAIVAIGVLSALLVVPQVRAIAGGILASGAVLAIVVGFAAQTTLVELHLRPADRIQPSRCGSATASPWAARRASSRRSG